MFWCFITIFNCSSEHVNLSECLSKVFYYRCCKQCNARAQEIDCVYQNKQHVMDCIFAINDEACVIIVTM